jgi:uncharacterized protein DUF6933
MIVRCTKKTLDLLGGPSVTVEEVPATNEDWYLDLLWIDRRKCLLLTHAGTLFSVFRASIKTADLRPLGPYLCAAIQTELHGERLAADTLGRLQPDHVRAARTASRSTLGSMNQMTREIRYHVAHRGGLPGCDIDELNRQLRRTPRYRDGYARPIDLVADDCAPIAPPKRTVDIARGPDPETWTPSRKSRVAREAPNHRQRHGS